MGDQATEAAGPIASGSRAPVNIIRQLPHLSATPWDGRVDFEDRFDKYRNLPNPFSSDHNPIASTSAHVDRVPSYLAHQGLPHLASPDYSNVVWNSNDNQPGQNAGQPYTPYYAMAAPSPPLPAPPAQPAQPALPDQPNSLKSAAGFLKAAAAHRQRGIAKANYDEALLEGRVRPFSQSITDKLYKIHGNNLPVHAPTSFKDPNDPLNTFPIGRLQAQVLGYGRIMPAKKIPPVVVPPPVGAASGPVITHPRNIFDVANGVPLPKFKIVDSLAGPRLIGPKNNLVRNPKRKLDQLKEEIPPELRGLIPPDPNAPPEPPKKKMGRPKKALSLPDPPVSSNVLLDPSAAASSSNPNGEPVKKKRGRKPKIAAPVPDLSIGSNNPPVASANASSSNPNADAEPPAKKRKKAKKDAAPLPDSTVAPNPPPVLSAGAASINPNAELEPVKKKRGRKPKIAAPLPDQPVVPSAPLVLPAEESSTKDPNAELKPAPKKRGRKPKNPPALPDPSVFPNTTPVTSAKESSSNTNAETEPPAKKKKKSKTDAAPLPDPPFAPNPPPVAPNPPPVGTLEQESSKGLSSASSKDSALIPVKTIPNKTISLEVPSLPAPPVVPYTSLFDPAGVTLFSTQSKMSVETIRRDVPSLPAADQPAPPSSLLSEIAVQPSSEAVPKEKVSIPFVLAAPKSLLPELVPDDESIPNYPIKYDTTFSPPRFESPKDERKFGTEYNFTVDDVYSFHTSTLLDVPISDYICTLCKVHLSPLPSSVPSTVKQIAWNAERDPDHLLSAQGNPLVEKHYKKCMKLIANPIRVILGKMIRGEAENSRGKNLKGKLVAKPKIKPTEEEKRKVEEKKQKAVEEKAVEKKKYDENARRSSRAVATMAAIVAAEEEEVDDPDDEVELAQEKEAELKGTEEEPASVPVKIALDPTTPGIPTRSYERKAKETENIYAAPAKKQGRTTSAAIAKREAAAKLLAIDSEDDGEGSSYGTPAAVSVGTPDERETEIAPRAVKRKVVQGGKVRKIVVFAHGKKFVKKSTRVKFDKPGRDTINFEGSSFHFVELTLFTKTDLFAQ